MYKFLEQEQYRCNVKSSLTSDIHNYTECRYILSGPNWIGPGGNLTCTLLRRACYGLREGFEKKWEGSDHGHNCVSTYAEITITIVYPKRMRVCQTRFSSAIR